MRIKKKNNICTLCKEPCYGVKYCSNCYTLKAQKGRTPWNKGIHTGIIPKTAFKKGERFNPDGEFKIKLNPAYKVLKNYKFIHHQVNKLFGKAPECKLNSSHKSSRYHWANISGEYILERKDWISLCPKCHFAFDRKGLVIPYA